MRLVCVLPEQIAQAWEVAGHYIVNAMTRSGVGDAAPIYADVLAGRSLLWVACDDASIFAAAVTDLTTANGRKICTIVACGGEDSRNWLHLIDELEQYARLEGCAVTRIIGRKGWLRRLPSYRQRAVIMERTL